MWDKFPMSDTFVSALPLAFGLAVGIVLFLPWSAGAAGRGVVRDALFAIRALILPIILIAVLGAFRGPHPALRFLVGFTAAAVVVAWLRAGEWRMTFLPPRRLVPRLPDGSVHQRATHAIVVSVLLFLALLLFLQIGLDIGSGDDDGLGGLPTDMAVAAGLIWLFAVVLRVLGFASTPVRLAVAVLAVAALARGLLAVGVLGVSMDHADRPTPALMLGAFLVAFGICVLAQGLSAETQPTAGILYQLTRTWKQGLWPRISAWGLGLVLGATVYLGLALVVGWWEVSRGSSTSVEGLPLAGKAELPLAGYGDRQLALAFLPILRFDEKAQWTPRAVNAVDGYLARADLVRPDAPQRSLKHGLELRDLPKQCRNPWTDPCYALTIHCASTESRSKQCPEGPPMQPHDPRDMPYREGAAYVRVVRKSSPPKEEPYPFQDVGPPDIREQLSTLVQYWFFYDYDEWVAPVLGGRIVQRHEGDWENVTVGLADDRPLFVAFSQHCGGVWQRWRDRVRLVSTTGPLFEADIPVVGPAAMEGTAGPGSWQAGRGTPTHPAVSVAVGSQANYPPAKAGRAPDWSTCRGFPGESVELVSYVWNIRDRTGSDHMWLPAQLKLVTAHRRPMSFPGTWGEKDTIQYVTVKDDPDKAGHNGPRTPTRQPLWRTPVRQIFCGKGWRRDGGKRNYSCKK